METPALQPMRFAPASIIFMASSSVRIPPAALADGLAHKRNILWCRAAGSESGGRLHEIKSSLLCKMTGQHYKDIVHFHDEGYRILAGQVVKSIDSFSTPAPMR